MIYIALKDWERALVFLETVIASPVARDNTGGTSRIQVEAYKKWILVGLVHKGQVSADSPYCQLQARLTSFGDTTHAKEHQRPGNEDLSGFERALHISR